jgi:hypothetical protein
VGIAHADEARHSPIGKSVLIDCLKEYPYPTTYRVVERVDGPRFGCTFSVVESGLTKDEASARARKRGIGAPTFTRYAAQSESVHTGHVCRAFDITL